jgi:chloramphenicol O-acetyltransferase type B
MLKTMLRKYIDTTFLINPLSEYFSWFWFKTCYQLTYWGKHLRISYGAYVRKCVFSRGNFIGRNTHLVNCVLGDGTYISYGCMITQTTFGNYCSIGPGVKIAPGRHPVSMFVSTHPAFFSRPSFLSESFAPGELYSGNLPVRIGNDVWIGANAIILDGLTIADGAVVAANAVVTRDVLPYQLVGGTPARPIRKRFSEDQITRLLKIRWWNKSTDWLRQNAGSFQDIDQFIISMQDGKTASGEI